MILSSTGRTLPFWRRVTSLDGVLLWRDYRESSRGLIRLPVEHTLHLGLEVWVEPFRLQPTARVDVHEPGLRLSW